MRKEHDFLSNSSELQASNCSDCKKRSILICLKCGACYLCHTELERHLKQVVLEIQ